MEPLESPRVTQVGGILSTGEDTDGERTDDEVDYPTDSFVSQHQEEEEDDDDDDAHDSAGELEVTGEGTAGGPFGLKRVLFVRKKSEKAVLNREDPNKPPEPTFKDRFSKLGAGVGEKFAALGSIMQDHSKTAATATSGAPKPDDPPAEAAGQLGEAVRSTQVKPPGTAPPLALHPAAPKECLEYFQEYDLTFTSKPEFSIVRGPDGKGAVVSWEADVPVADSSGGETPAASPAAAAASAQPPIEADHVPPSGAVVIAVAGESVTEAELGDIVARVLSGTSTKGNSGRKEAEEDGQPSTDDPSGGGGNGGAFPLVIRFREKTTLRQEDAHAAGAGGEVFRNRMKAMAAGFGNLFQVKEPGGSAVRDGFDVAGSASGAGGNAAAAGASDAFVLTFAAKQASTEALPFAMAEMVGGLGVVVARVSEDYASALVRPEEGGVSTAGTAAIPVDGAGGGSEGAGGALEVLAPGAVLLRVAGQSVEGKGVQHVRKVLEAAAAEHEAVKILFRRAPPIYRANVAAELVLEEAKAPHLHVGTWLPVLKRRAGVTLGGGGDGDNGGGGSGGGGGVIGLGYGGEEWEDVHATMARAQRFVNGFRSVGIRVDVTSMQTVTLPRNVKSAYASTFEGRPSTFQQAVRVLFSFPDERTVSLPKQSTSEKLGLTHVDAKGAGPMGSWVTVAAADASPCAEAGLPVGEGSILTHVNGFDVSPAAYRSLAPLPFGQGEGWAAAVLPALESGLGDTITLTFV